jgi:RimJ/RimL family protein N-acetyltransferase
MKFKEGRTIKKFFVVKDDRHMEVIFRFAKMDDAAEAMKFFNSLVEEKVMIGGMKKINIAKEKKWLSEGLKNSRKGHSILMVTEVNGKFAAINDISRQRADVNKHVVDLGIALGKEYRGVGIGRKMLETLILLARKELKAEIITLRVFGSNRVAHRLYSSLGFIEIGRVPKGIKHYGRYHDDVIMMLKK